MKPIKSKTFLLQKFKEEREWAKKLGKYSPAFDYVDKVLIAYLSQTNGGVSIISFTSVVGVPVGKASTSFTLVFSLATRIIKKLSSKTRNKKKKHSN